MRSYVQVVHLYNELRKALPELMGLVHNPADRVKVSSPSAEFLTKDKLQAHDKVTIPSAQSLYNALIFVNQAFKESEMNIRIQTKARSERLHHSGARLSTCAFPRGWH